VPRVRDREGREVEGMKTNALWDSRRFRYCGHSLCHFSM